VEVVIDPQGQINHLFGFENDFGAAAKTSKEMADVAVVLLDREGQVFAGEELIFRDEPVETLPIVGEESFAFDADFVEELSTEPAPAQAGVASSRPPSTQAMVRRATGSYARQIHSLQVFF
jgi:hypothetical protein